MTPFVLSGGSGTRLWPVSRESFPKQFCDLLDESLMIKTLRRLAPLGAPGIITTQGMKVLTERALRDLGLSSDLALYEPKGKNTAAAIGLACRVMELRGREQEVMGIFPADPYIENEQLFREAVKLAESCAKDERVVTLGISPSYAATGYGYIHLSPDAVKSGNGLAARAALSFHEKPSLDTAKKFVESRAYVWNAGIFVFRADVMLKHLSRLLPKTFSALRTLEPDLSNVAEVYDRVESISIDYAVMEKLTDLLCIPCDIGWSDVGSWDEVLNFQKDKKTPVYEEKACGNQVFTTDPIQKAYAFVGIDDVTLVDTRDAVLVVKKGESQSVKEVHAKVKAAGHRSASEHLFEFRPWGTFEILRDTNDFKTKVIRVEPGHQLSYQSHKKRAEHWIVIKGHPEVVLNDEVLKPKPGESVYIPVGAKHRIRNPSKTPHDVVEFVEVQVGTYFGEDDIIRYEDDYARK